MPDKLRMGSISLKILLSYLSILLTPLLAIIIIYISAITAILRAQEEKMLSTLGQTVDVLDIRLGELYGIEQHLSQNAQVLSILNKRWTPSGGSAVYDIYRLCGAMPNYKLTNQIVENLYIFFNREQTVMKQTNAFLLNHYSYESNIAFGSLSYSDFQKLSGAGGYNGSLAALPDTPEQACVLMLQSLPMAGSDAPEGLIVIELRAAALTEALGANSIGPEGMAFIRDGEERTVALIAGEKCALDARSALEMNFEERGNYFTTEIGGVEYDVCTLRSSFADWRYATLVPREFLTSEVRPIRSAIVVLGAASAGIGGLVCLALWRRRRQLIRQISLTAEELGVAPEGASSEYSFLDGTMTRVAHTLDTLRSTLRAQETLLVSSVLRKILYGDFASGDAFSEEIASAGLSFKAAGYFVVIASPAAPDAVAAEDRFQFKQFLAERLCLPYYAYDMDEKNLALILFDDNGRSCADIAALCARLACVRSGESETLFAVSGSCKSTENLCALFSEALEIGRFARARGLSGALTAECLPRAGDSFYCPPETELRLMQLIRCGEPCELIRLQTELYAENFEKRSLTLPMNRYLTELLRLTAVRLLKDIAGDARAAFILQKLSLDESVRDVFESMLRANSVLRCAALDGKRRGQLALKEHIRDIVENCCADSTFNIAALAAQCQTPETTLYKNFRAYFGMTFSEYLENLRIQKACGLLRQHLPVKDIALMVGYSSDYSFRRAFKRIMNVSPSMFAETILS